MHDPVQIVADVPNASSVLMTSLGISEDRARGALRSLLEAGFIIAPREPTNDMFVAYLTALGGSRTLSGPSLNNMMHACGKARRRWKAMADAGCEMVMSRVMNSELDSEPVE